MKFASLGSGSSGNATLVSSSTTTVLVDCGFGVRETDRRLSRLNISPQEISALVVTHEHSDHMKGVGAFSRKYQCPVFMSHGTYVSRDYGKIPCIEFISSGNPFTIGDLSVLPVTVPHDAREPLQFIFENNNLRLGVLTDLGSVSEYVIQAYRNCDALLLEANHDSRMLASGPYPPSLRSRVGGQWGHLNNQQTAALLAELNLQRLQHLVVGHISRQNNTVELAKSALSGLEKLTQNILFACQDDGFDWLELNLSS